MKNKINLKESVKKAFMKDLKALLRKYDARLSAESRGTGDSDYVVDYRMYVYVDGMLSVNGRVVGPSVVLDLGRYVDGKK